MKERIKQLIKQSTTYHNGGLGTEIEVFDKEKFAELIAKECMVICENLSFSVEGPSHEAKYQRNLCALAIADSFGIPSEFRK
jgi:hypothetical protein